MRTCYYFCFNCIAFLSDAVELGVSIHSKTSTGHASIQAPSATQRGDKIKNYYIPESVGIATGILITALHNAGLATLTHTPSPMNFLRDILGRKENERAFLILVTGLPSENATVPDIQKKNFEDYTSFF